MHFFCNGSYLHIPHESPKNPFYCLNECSRPVDSQQGSGNLISNCGSMGGGGGEMTLISPNKT